MDINNYKFTIFLEKKKFNELLVEILQHELHILEKYFVFL